MLAGKAEQMRELLGFETEPAERQFRDTFLAELRNAFGEPQFRDHYRRGRALKLEDAIRLIQNA